ncbi:MAG: hypothetical protein KME31_12555 [Tolypothrix carrinoi HA7290-LM1]|nr:hypothetical protein [Tolypothrix carrinoi HA7290-LM1]
MDGNVATGERRFGTRDVLCFLWHSSRLSFFISSFDAIALRLPLLKKKENFSLLLLSDRSFMRGKSTRSEARSSP